ncbi:MAG: coproporphyrinogen III oxidase family protein [Ignavibacteriae bacterium]|nr:MAG: coproporphyrinogen III oxidase family protein [Ignavibacteriota bacterium]
MKTTACYIHIPFCDHKCIYCDFYSVITTDTISSFLKSLKEEINFYGDRYSSNRIITSIFFGGGTPSLMEPGYLHEIISAVKENFNLKEDSETTMETNPGTVDIKKLAAFRKAGINRISIGIQSFNDDELKFLTRIHDSETAKKTIRETIEAGFKNVSIDLIFNLPKQTKQIWLSNLKQAIQLPIKHISTYSLILERGTILNKMVLDGKVKMQSDDYDADLYETTIDFLTQNGFYQYEVSSFAKPDFECLHNNSYWHYKDYFGFGTSAHSFIDGKRWWNYSSVKKYVNEVTKNGMAVANQEQVTIKESHSEYVMLALRSSGIELKNYKKRFCNDWLKKNNSYFEELLKKDLILFDDKVLKLTAKGYTLCDEILKNIL